ncbi:MFS transporter [Dyadobacter pollutisoli]|uniref:MFS transporter n=1 Tax=Dyadobacter pollutisoli TaxID=2910158 RepID=A0A9E8N7Q5_9BACT|nr:MFS transporter [Dyadobacter pollutisoli]WAC10086.1 MFS transporter [Dyadobacter pollutisoli]
MTDTFRKQQWKMLLLTMFCYLFFYTGRHNFGWAAQGMVTDFNVPFATIGWISFAMLMGYAIGQFVNGNLADRFSARIMMPLGAYLSIGTNVAISFAPSLNWIMVLWAMNGFFQSMAWAPGGKIISNWWGKEEKGKAFGFYTMAAGLSSVVTYLLSILILKQNMEWRMLFRLPVLLLLITATLFLIFAKDKPSDLGFENPDENLTLRTGMKEDSWQMRYKDVLGNISFLRVTLAFGFESMARYGFIFWVPVHYLGGNWKDNPNNLWVTFLLPVGMAAGAVSFGSLSDTVFGRNRVASIRFGMLSSALIALIIFISPAENMALQAFFMLLAGFFVYGPQANFWTLCPEMLGNERTGTGIGLMNMTGYLFAALGEPLLGKVIDITGNTSHIFLIIAFICLVSAGAISTVSKSTYIAMRT